jgi:SEC-C motif-containing protein
VEFKAHYRIGKSRGVRHERSRFVKKSGRWLYVGGDSY